MKLKGALYKISSTIIDGNTKAQSSKFFILTINITLSFSSKSFNATVINPVFHILSKVNPWRKLTKLEHFKAIFGYIIEVVYIKFFARELDAQWTESELKQPDFST